MTRPLARLDVAQALKDRHLDLPAPPGGWSWPLALAAAALARRASLPPAGEIPVGGYLSIGLALAASVIAVGPASRALLARIPASDAPLRALARAQVRSLPGHLSAMVSGIVVSVALTAAMAIMVFSFRVSLDGWLSGVLGADLFARAAPQRRRRRLRPEAQARIAAAARRRAHRADPLRAPHARGKHGPAHVMARPVDARAPARASRPSRPCVPRARGPIAGVDLGGRRRPLRLEAGRGRHAAARGAQRAPSASRACSATTRAPGARSSWTSATTGRSRATRSPTTSPSTSRPAPTRGRCEGGSAKVAGRGAGRGTARRRVHPRARAVDLRPHLRRHLRARGDRDPHRARRRDLELRRARVVAAARVRRASPPGARAPRGAAAPRPRGRRRGHRRRRPRADRGRRRERRAGARGEPAVVPLGHGDPLAVARARDPRGLGRVRCARWAPRRAGRAAVAREAVRRGEGRCVGSPRSSWLFAFACATLAADYAPVAPGLKLAFPADFGAHPRHRIEWWYVTGHLDTPKGPMGFQVTFFRLRNKAADANPSRFAPTAAALRARGARRPRARQASPRPAHRARLSRRSPRRAPATPTSSSTTGPSSASDGRYLARIPGDGFALDLVLTPTQPVLAARRRGLQPQGPAPVAGERLLQRAAPRGGGHGEGGREGHRGQGRARGSTTNGPARSSPATPWAGTGWGSTSRAAARSWPFACATRRAARCGRRARCARAARCARSRRTRCASRRGAPGDRRAPASPGPWRWHFEVAGERWSVAPLMDDQEMDARGSTGTLYWEGAVTATGPERREGARLPRAHGLFGEAAVLSATASSHAAEGVAPAESVRSEVGDIPAIEGLRGVAVLWVMVFHYFVAARRQVRRRVHRRS